MLFKTPGLVESSSPKFDLFFDIKEHSEEEETTKIMTKTMEKYMSKTRGNYGLGVARPKINDKTHFELKGKFLKELRESTFSGSEHEDANEHIKKVLEIIVLFHILDVTQDQIMLRAFPMSLTRAASRWLINEPLVIMEYLAKISKKARILELKQRHLKIIVLTSNTLYPSRKIRRICACTSQKTTKETRSIHRIQRIPIRRIQAMEIKYSGRYRTWSLLQETPNTPYRSLLVRRIGHFPDLINRKLKNEF
ncbi:hypothetical protein Tco_0517025 [Tanacetum coccineum]